MTFYYLDASVWVKRYLREPGTDWVATLFARQTDSSYLAANDPRAQFGLGERPEIEAVVVEWPDGSKEEWGKVQGDRVVVLKQGSGATL